MIDAGNTQFEYGERPKKCVKCTISRTQPSKELNEKQECFNEEQCNKFKKELVKDIANQPETPK